MSHLFLWLNIFTRSRLLQLTRYTNYLLTYLFLRVLPTADKRQNSNYVADSFIVALMTRSCHKRFL